MNRRILILGGKGDIGSAIAQKFQDQKNQVVVTGRNEMDLNRTDMIDSFFSKHGIEFDVLIHSAGWNQPKAIDEVSIDELKQSLQINVLGFFQVIKHLLPYFKTQKQGHILAISSLYGSFSRVNRLPYVTSKHALNGMIKTLALELGAYNIKVNSLSPGFVDTKMTRNNNNQEILDSFVKKTALGRLASVQDIAEVSYFLCSEQNQYLHGQDIVVDGGYSVGGFQNI